MPFSVSGELCMVRKAVRHALIMALETFTIDDKIYLSWSTISGYRARLCFTDAAAGACRRALSRTTVTRLLSAVSAGLYAVGGTGSRHAANRNTGAQTKPTLTIHSCTE